MRQRRSCGLEDVEQLKPFDHFRRRLQLPVTHMPIYSVHLAFDFLNLFLRTRIHEPDMWQFSLNNLAPPCRILQMLDILTLEYLFVCLFYRFCTTSRIFSRGLLTVIFWCIPGCWWSYSLSGCVLVLSLSLSSQATARSPSLGSSSLHSPRAHSPIARSICHCRNPIHFSLHFGNLPNDIWKQV